MRKAKTFEELKGYSEAMNEHNDCTIKAIVATTLKPYREVHGWFAWYGRKQGHGVSTQVMQMVARQLGYDMKPVQDRLIKIRNKKGSGVTTKTIGKYLPVSKKFIAGSRGHVTGIYRGRVIDWAANNNKRVTQLWEMVKK